MSLCPNYCECQPCKHGRKVCSHECYECEQEYARKLHQQQHEDSVKRQRNRLKEAPWRKHDGPE